jgi:hypothetical protein
MRFSHTSQESSDVQFVMPFVDERFDTIHRLLRQQNLTVIPGEINSQVENSKAYRESAQIITRTIPHEAGHAIIGLALDAGNVLEWIAIYVFRDGEPGGGCKWGEKPAPKEHQWMSLAGGMAGEKLQYGDFLAGSARIDKADLTRKGFDSTKLPELITRCSEVIQKHESAWKEIQQLLYERTVSDLNDRIDAIRQGDVDVGVVTGQEARDIFAGKAITR